MSQPKNIFNRLPNELLDMIKDNLEPHDLSGHISFSQVTPCTAPLYNEEFWRRLCRLNGLGVLPDEEDELEEVDWTKVARECSLHAQRCSHPGCGSARLAENVKDMMEYAEAHPDLATLTLADEEIYAYSSTIFQHIAFKKVGMYYDLQNVAYLRPMDNGRPSDMIADHPIARRTFAVLPPVDTMSIIYLSEPSLELDATDGMTVAHVLQAMPEILKKRLSVEDVVDLVESTGDDEVFPRRWSTADRFRSLSTMADWFRIAHWCGFSCAETNAESRYYTLDCDSAPERLPKKYDDLVEVDDIVYNVGFDDLENLPVDDVDVDNV